MHSYWLRRREFPKLPVELWVKIWEWKTYLECDTYWHSGKQIKIKHRGRIYSSILPISQPSKNFNKALAKFALENDMHFYLTKEKCLMEDFNFIILLETSDYLDMINKVTHPAGAYGCLLQTILLLNHTPQKINDCSQTTPSGTTFTGPLLNYSRQVPPQPTGPAQSTNFNKCLTLQMTPRPELNAHDVPPTTRLPIPKASTMVLSAPDAESFLAAPNDPFPPSPPSPTDSDCSLCQAWDKCSFHNYT